MQVLPLASSHLVDTLEVCALCGASIEGDRRSGSMMKAESHATRTTLFHLALGLVILGAAF
ncbi:MAG TPA: hypothetical protein PLC54_04590, partial [Spirochaetales bacterium]|nr:hypothetical protein [Spirochaetales bacterium]